MDRRAGSALPSASINVVELLLFRSYQLPAVAMFAYYLSILVGVMYTVNAIYVGAKSIGSGAAVLGAFTGVVFTCAAVVATRLGTEVCLSLYELRDGAVAAAAAAPRHAPAPYAAPPPQAPPTVVATAGVAEGGYQTGYQTSAV
eukprot:TRINITY_DN3555_c0_g1_i1.p1 TRINITY_DN3555_c0_g1~~TRINITY_DN3555_c0_g1_i1.p1  ORF type:complete len:159 (-),score=58.89 TRINITY_DN3555_c0_g1_i1:172-603(-)